MKVALIRDGMDLNSAQAYITKALYDGFQHNGADVSIANSLLDLNVTQSEPMLILDDLTNFKDQRTLTRLIEILGSKIVYGVWSHWPLVSGGKYENIYLKALHILKESNNTFFYGERESCSMGDFEAIFGKYYVIPNPAPMLPPNRAWMGATRCNYDYDVCFVGAKYKTKSFLFDEVMPHLKSVYPQLKCGFFGRGFNKRVRICNALIKLIGSTPLKQNYLSKKLTTYLSRIGKPISVENEPTLYRASKICVNCHESVENHIIYNMRYFKIPYYGGFQICDSPLPVSPYFQQDEVVHISSKNLEDWVAKLIFFLENDDEREKIRKNGLIRAQKEHSCSHRAAYIMNIASALMTHHI